jgi:hypothetical protein
LFFGIIVDEHAYVGARRSTGPTCTWLALLVVRDANVAPIAFRPAEVIFTSNTFSDAGWSQSTCARTRHHGGISSHDRRETGGLFRAGRVGSPSRPECVNCQGVAQTSEFSLPTVVSWAADPQSGPKLTGIYADRSRYRVPRVTSRSSPRLSAQALEAPRKAQRRAPERQRIARCPVMA